jgi:outer membrane protein OmpA-like peptidoglycan-associated protein
MKKVFLVLMVSLFGFSSFAQDETVIEIQGEKGPYVTNGFWSNWFISAAGGAQVYFGDSDTYGDFGHRIAPALDISAGKWITPCTGVRLQYSGLKAKGDYDESFNTMNLHADFLWNISNAIGGEKDRFWNLVPFAGMGWAVASGNGTTRDEIAVTIGLLHNWRLTSALDMNIEMKSMLVNNRFALSQSGNKLDALGTITVGLTYNFGERGFQRASDLIVVEDNTRYVEQIAALESMLAKAEQKRLALLKQLEERNEELTDERSEELAVPVMPDLAIFFEIGKANLSDKALINIGYIADAIKQFPEKKFTLFASADKETGTPEYNMKLSKKRGDAVLNVLVEKFGVAPEQLTVQAVGSQQQKYEGAQLNRVVVIEDQE